jgi:hypothetical protein
MKEFRLIIITILLTNFCFAQATDIENFKLANVGYISIPSKMEIQAGTYKKFEEEFQKEAGKKFGYEVSGNRIVFQQKGLNEFESRSFSSYARVILETDIGNFGDYEKLTTNFTATQSEISELSKEIQREVNHSFEGTGLKLISWFGLSIIKLNGRTGLKISYLRQLNDNPYVIVNMYSFQNYDRLHRLTLSYRQSDQETWKPLFSTILNSFTITNVR